MNQILYTGKNKSQNKGPASLKSILRFFAIALIILGLIFLGGGSYKLYTNYVANQEEEEVLPATISFEQEGNNAIITATYSGGISKVKYHWNDEDETIVQGSGEQTVIVDDISISSGTNTLYVTVIDLDNNSTDSSYDFSYDGICIELAVVNNSDIQITASDVTGIAYITYKWNSDEEVVAYPDEEGATVIEQTTSIPSGLNTLTVVAVNSSNYTLTKTQDVEGILPPEISLYIDNGVLYVTVTDEEGIDSIVQQINDDDIETIDAEGATEYSYSYDFQNQEILITITATDVRGVSSTFKGKNY